MARGEPVPDERAPEVRLDVHDVDLRASLQRGIHPSIGALARPGHRILAIQRHRDRGQIDVGGIGRRRPAARSVPRRRDDRDRVTGLLEEPPLQAHRHLGTAERFDVLVAEHHDVHRTYSGSGSSR